MNKWLRKSLSLLALALVFVGVMTVASAADVEVTTSEEFVAALNDAASAEEATTIILKADVTLAEQIKNTYAQPLTITNDGTARTINFDAAQQARITVTGQVTIAGTESARITLSGGGVTQGSSYAIATLSSGTLLTCEYCDITGFVSTRNGSAFFLNGGSGLSLEHCNMYNNEAKSGACVALYNASGTTKHTTFTATDSVFTNNSTTGSGGVIYTYVDTTNEGGNAVVDVKNCEFNGNRASGGGVISIPACNPVAAPEVTFTNCSFTGNTVTGNGGVFLDTYQSKDADKGKEAWGTGATFDSCTFTGNTAKAGNVIYSIKATVKNCTADDGAGVDYQASNYESAYAEFYGVNSIGTIQYKKGSSTSQLRSSRTVTLFTGEPTEGTPAVAQLTLNYNGVTYNGTEQGIDFEVGDYSNMYDYTLAINGVEVAGIDCGDTIDIWDKLTEDQQKGDEEFTVTVTANVSAKEYVARLGSEAFENLEDAFAAVEDYTGAPVEFKLLKDVELTDITELMLPEMVTIVVDKDLSISGPLTINGDELERTNAAITVAAGATLTMENGVRITNMLNPSKADASYGGAIYAEGNVVLNDCDINNCTAYTGAAVYLNYGANAKLTATGCSFDDNTATYGAPFYGRYNGTNQATELVFDGCFFRRNETNGTAASSANLVYAGRTTMTGCLVDRPEGSEASDIKIVAFASTYLKTSGGAPLGIVELYKGSKGTDLSQYIQFIGDFTGSMTVRVPYTLINSSDEETGKRANPVVKNSEYMAAALEHVELDPASDTATEAFLGNDGYLHAIGGTVAEIDGIQYYALETAILNANPGDVITLLDYAELGAGFHTINNKIDLKGKTLYINGNVTVNSDGAISNGTVIVNTSYNIINFGKNGGNVPVLTAKSGEYNTYKMYAIDTKVKTANTYADGARFKLGFKFADDAAYAAAKAAYEMGADLRMGLAITDGEYGALDGLQGTVSLGAASMAALDTVDTTDATSFYQAYVTMRSASLKSLETKAMLKSTADVGFFLTGDTTATWSK